MVTLYLMKEKNEMINFIGIACGDNLEIDNNKKEVKMHIKGEIASIIKFHTMQEIRENYYDVFI